MQGKIESYEIQSAWNSKYAVTARLSWAETYDIAGNTHILALSLECKITKGQTGGTYYLGNKSSAGYIGSITVNGRPAVEFNNNLGTHYIVLGKNYSPVRAADEYPAQPWDSHPVEGETDGQCSAEISMDFYGYNPDGSGANGFHIVDTRTITLTQIPRASTISATDANIGSVSSVMIGKKSDGYTHTVRYKFGSLTGYLTESGGISSQAIRLSSTVIPWRIPESFYNQIPNASSGSCQLTCTTYTYSGSQQIGDPQTTEITVSASLASCAPIVSGSYTDINPATIAVTGNNQTLIRYSSTVRCTIQAQARNGATITEKTVNGEPASGGSITIQDPDTGTLIFRALDSRGYAGSYTAEAMIIPYIPLTANASVRRDDPTSGNATLAVLGNYYPGSFGAAGNTLILNYEVDGGIAQTAAPAISGEGYKLTQRLAGLDYRLRHTITVRVTDLIGTISKTVRLEPGIPVFDWGKRDFVFHVPVELAAGVKGLHAPSNHPYCYWRLVDEDREWIQPPMEIGTTYRTALRFRGLPVYTRLDYGLLVPGGTATYTIQGMDDLIEYSGTVGDHSPLPRLTADPTEWVTVDAGSRGEIRVQAGSNVPEWGFYMQAFFTVNSSYKPDRSNATLGLGALGKMKLGD